MPIADSQRLLVSCLWVVRERRGGGWVEVLRKYNKVTDAGLTALSAAFSGAAPFDAYIVLEANAAKLQATYAIGVTSIVVDKQAHQTGDTQLVLSPDTGNAETVTFSAYNAGTKTYTIGATTKGHTAQDLCVRAVKQTDTMTNVASEIAPNPTVAPTDRSPLVATYSPGVGQTTYQFYLTGDSANAIISHIGIADDSQLGAGNLLTHLAFGVDHTFTLPANANDLQIEGTLTLVNN